MRQLVHEEPIVPVFIDRDKELQAYYSCVDALVKDPPLASGVTPSAPGHYPPPGGYQPTPWQPNPYAPQGAYAGYPPQPTGYPPPPTQAPYPGYQPNPAYPAYPQPSGYPQAQPNPYGGYPGYQGYVQPPPQGGWPGYYEQYGGYAQPQQPAPYQSPYPAYGGYPPPGPQTTQEFVTKKHKSEERSAGSELEGQESRGFGWSDTLFSDDYDYRPSAHPTDSSYYAGQNLVQETVTMSHASTDYIGDYYARQFERLQIGWNV